MCGGRGRGRRGGTVEVLARILLTMRLQMISWFCEGDEGSGNALAIEGREAMNNEKSSFSQLQVNAIAFKEGDAWVVQGIEYDIVAHAYDVVTAPYAFLRAVVENMVITEHLGRNPLEGVKPAPERFRSMYEEAKLEMRPLKKQQEWPEIAVRVAA